MIGVEKHLVFPYLGLVALLILSFMGIGQWGWERIAPSRRDKSTWIDRIGDYLISVAYVGAVLSIPSIYYDGWKTTAITDPLGAASSHIKARNR